MHLSLTSNNTPGIDGIARLNVEYLMLNTEYTVMNRSLAASVYFLGCSKIVCKPDEHVERERESMSSERDNPM